MKDHFLLECLHADGKHMTDMQRVLYSDSTNTGSYGTVTLPVDTMYVSAGTTV